MCLNPKHPGDQLRRQNILRRPLIHNPTSAHDKKMAAKQRSQIQIMHDRNDS
ncbi:hypothetical protein D3C74_425590 [compost metagenome]